MLTTTVFVVAVGAAFSGGFIDAIAGGGGLIVLPALLMTNLPPHLCLSVNKFSACLGTGFALGNFARSGLIVWPIALTGILFSLLGAHLGSRLTLIIPQEFLGKILIFLLPVAFIITLIRPEQHNDPVSFRKLPTILLCTAIGIYDGFFGPGTGSFLILGFYTILKLPLLQASATAKVLNFASNFSSTITFLIFGSILWPLALPMALASILGNVMGSRLAIHRGSRIVQRFLMVSLGILMVTLIWKYFFVRA